jgi:hypothetical protein
MATVAAGPVFRLLGARDIGEKEDYRVAKMPPVNTDMLEGELPGVSTTAVMRIAPT